MTSNLTGVELVQMTSPQGDHQANGLADVGVREIKAQTRILRSQLEERLGGNRTDEKDPLMSWIPRHAANCPDTESWTMAEHLISDDAERLGNVQWWSLASQCTSDQLAKTAQCEAETKACCAVSVWWDITRDPDGVKRGMRDCENFGGRKMGSRVRRNVCWSSVAVEARSAKSGETCCACGRSRTRCRARECDACCSEN